MAILEELDNPHNNLAIKKISNSYLVLKIPNWRTKSKINSIEDQLLCVDTLKLWLQQLTNYNPKYARRKKIILGTNFV